MAATYCASNQRFAVANSWQTERESEIDTTTFGTICELQENLPFIVAHVSKLLNKMLRLLDGTTLALLFSAAVTETLLYIYI